MTFDRAKNALKVTNITNVLQSESLRANTPFVFIPGAESYYLHEGKEVEQRQFEKDYPLAKFIKTAYKGENSDRTKNWINDEKSY